MDKLNALRKALHNVVNNDWIKCREIDSILYNNILQCNITSSISKDYCQQLNLDDIKSLQNKQYAHQFARELIERKGIHIENENPEDYRSENGDLPGWSNWEERRTAKLWVLK